MNKYVGKDSLCRNCPHTRQFHVMYQQIMEGYNLSKYILVLEYVPCVEFKIDGQSLCNCTDFQSRDNLEYLERKYEEKQK